MEIADKLEQREKEKNKEGRSEKASREAGKERSLLKEQRSGSGTFVCRGLRKPGREAPPEIECSHPPSERAAVCR